MTVKKNDAQKEREFNRVQDSALKAKTSLGKAYKKSIEQKENKPMKKLTINPQIKGALKLILVMLVLGAAFYVGTQYQEQYHQKITSEAKSLVTSLKIK